MLIKKEKIIRITLKKNFEIHLIEFMRPMTG